MWGLTASPFLAQTTNPPPPPDPIKTTITVNERISAEAPAAVTTLDATQLKATPGVNLDDRLRQVPGFSLFRRSSSLVANPTTQGISLRGLGSTGASRSLVLWDGVPMNDPFGGWIYWTRFAPEQIDRVEIERGASTSLFGDRAMAGALSIVSREVDRFHANASYSAGNATTHELAAGLSALLSRAAVSGQVRAFSTGGYFIVPAAVRGPIDTHAGVDFVAGNARVDLLGAAHRLFLKLDILAEDRANGTTLTGNSTSLGTLSGTWTWQRARDGFSATAFHTREDFHASFSSTGAGRRIETLAYLQQVPSQASGGAAFWSHSERRLHFIAGADVERDQGTSTDRLSPAGLRVGGGNRLEHGVFAQVDFKAGPAQLFAGVRHTFTGPDTFLSPSAGVVAGRGRWRGRGSVYRSFRAPTLNELYREFRAGNTITRANPALRPETLNGGEIGADYSGENTRIGVTAFRNSLDDLITNVTLSTGSTITRQRQNAAAATAQGVEADFKQRWRDFRVELSYLLADSRYAAGLRIPQVPKHQGSAQVTYSKRGTTASFGVRTYALQFDDDLNQFRLPGFATLQFWLGQRLRRGFDVAFAMENAANREFLTVFSPTPGTGAPRLFRASLRWSR